MQSKAEGRGTGAAYPPVLYLAPSKSEKGVSPSHCKHSPWQGAGKVQLVLVSGVNKAVNYYLGCEGCVGNPGLAQGKVRPQQDPRGPWKSGPASNPTYLYSHEPSSPDRGLQTKARGLTVLFMSSLLSCYEHLRTMGERGSVGSTMFWGLNSEP